MFVRAVLYFWWIQTISHARMQMEAQHHVRWVQHIDAYGTFYYEDTASDTVTWTAPVGEEYIPWVHVQA